MPPQRKSIWRTQTVSQYYGLDADQSTLDFVDVDVVADTRLFVDPRALRVLGETTSGRMSAVSFFETFSTVS
jgi:hypothetical protein